jgi:hypothetical protein
VLVLIRLIYSFVSPKAIPQMVDTTNVLAQLDLSQTKSKLLAIIANTEVLSWLQNIKKYSI